MIVWGRCHSTLRRCDNLFFFSIWNVPKPGSAPWKKSFTRRWWKGTAWHMLDFNLYLPTFSHFMHSQGTGTLFPQSPQSCQAIVCKFAIRSVSACLQVGWGGCLFAWRFETHGFILFLYHAWSMCEYKMSIYFNFRAFQFKKCSGGSAGEAVKAKSWYIKSPCEYACTCAGECVRAYKMLQDSLKLSRGSFQEKKKAHSQTYTLSRLIFAPQRQQDKAHTF